jgi:hypothetical protein
LIDSCSFLKGYPMVYCLHGGKISKYDKKFFKENIQDNSYTFVAQTESTRKQRFVFPIFGCLFKTKAKIYQLNVTIVRNGVKFLSVSQC